MYGTFGLLLKTDLKVAESNYRRESDRPPDQPGLFEKLALFEKHHSSHHFTA
jgi:hypothetical protein